MNADGQITDSRRNLCDGRDLDKILQELDDMASSHARYRINPTESTDEGSSIKYVTLGGRGGGKKM